MTASHELEATNKRIALEFLAAIAAGDLDRIEALLHPDCTWWVQGWGGIHRAAFVASLGSTIGRARSRTMQILAATAEADRVAVAAEGAFEFPEGVYANSYHYLFTIRNGRIHDGREYLDTRVAAAFFSGGDARSSSRQAAADENRIVR